MADTPADTATLNDDNHSGDRSPQRHVDDVVLRAEAEFNALSRQLTRHSQSEKKSLERPRTSSVRKDQVVARLCEYAASMVRTPR